MGSGNDGGMNTYTFKLKVEITAKDRKEAQKFLEKKIKMLYIMGVGMDSLSDGEATRLTDWKYGKV